MTVLNTRPLPMGRELQQDLEQAQITSIFAPQITTVAQTPDNLTSALQLTSNPNCLFIFVSRTAVKRFCQELADMGVSDFSPQGSIIAVGKGTKAELLKIFPQLTIVLPEKANSESLVEMPEFNDESVTHSVIVKGHGGRDLIQTKLLTRGVELTEVNVYRRESESYSVQSVETWLNSKVILATSVDIAESILNNLQSLPDDKNSEFIQRVNWLVLSDRIKQYLLQQDIPSIHIFNCEQADNSSIIKNIKTRLSEISE